MSKSLWVGLTGGIATGKSTVSSYLAKRGIPVVDADQLAQEAVAAGSEGLKQIVSQFGADFLDEKAELNRKKMAQLVFSNPEALKKIESIIHPLVQSRVQQLRSQYEKTGAPLIFYDVPLLFEKNLQDQFDKVVVVASDTEQQIQRMKDRNGWSLEQVQARLKNQLPLAEKIRQADFVLQNNSDVLSLYQQVDQMLQKIQSSKA